MKISPLNYVLITYFLMLSLARTFAQDHVNFVHLDKVFRNTSSILADQDGSVWVSDLDGLYRYNGYEFSPLTFQKIFGEGYKNKKDALLARDKIGNIWITTSLNRLAKVEPSGRTRVFNRENATNSFTEIVPVEDKVWFGSEDGTVYQYYEESETFHPIFSLPVALSRIQGVEAMVFDGIQMVYITSTRQKLYSYNLESEDLEELILPMPLKSFEKLYVTTDVSGKLWVATENEGLLFYENRKFSQFEFSGNESYLNQTLFRCIYKDSNGRIWAGTDGDGLVRINPTTNTYEVYKKNERNPNSLSSNTIRRISEDSSGNLWLLVKGGKIDILPQNRNNLEYFPGLPEDIPVRVLSGYKSSDGSLYIGTDGYGLTSVTSEGNTINYLDENILPAEYIQSLQEDAQGNIWVGTYLNGLYVLNPKKQKAIKIEEGLIDVNDVREVYVDREDRIWIGSAIGIRVYDTDQSLLAYFDFGKKGLEGDVIEAFAQDKQGTIYAAGASGLFEIVTKRGLQQSDFNQIKYYEEGEEQLYDYWISEMIIGNDGTMWMLCQSGFMIKMDTDKMSFESLLDEPGLGQVEIESFQLDPDGNLWLSSKNGLHEFDPFSKHLRTFYFSDGLQGDQFIRRSSFMDQSSKLYFGGTNGLSAFYPSEIEQYYPAAALFINDIEVLNSAAEEVIPKQVEKGYSAVETLDLEAGQSSFSIGFYAISNVIDPDFKYAYRLKGFNDNWIEATNTRQSTYTNIPKGDYTYEVRAAYKNTEEILAERQIAISIAPYWWESYWAILGYILVLGYIFYWYWKYIQARAELSKEEWQHNQEREMYAMKMNFFAKMSHQIQTPLTLILAPINDMLQKASRKEGEAAQRLRLVKNNAERLSRIVKELTMVRNKTLNKLKLYIEPRDIIQNLSLLTASFSEIGRMKNVNFKVELPEKEIWLWYDHDKLEHVFYNLLSNAFKFTPTGGKIRLRLSETEDKVFISVVDNGPGISKEEQESIFNIFYQAEKGRQEKGMGVGLALSQELVGMHAGKLQLTSLPGEGSDFTVMLTKGKEHLLAKDDVVFLNTKKNSFTEEEAYDFDNWESDNEHISDTGKKTEILIVEDNIEMQVFLKDILSINYNISTANNGEEGLRKLEDKGISPALIISDVMMPVMDGITMSRTILKNKRLRHIPIILLTAKSDNTSRLIGLQTGAVSYISKPFNPSEILIRIKNVIQRKENIITNYQIKDISKSEVSEEDNKDILFMQEMTKLLKLNITNPDFKLEELSTKMAMSYSVIFRKCQEITGKSITEYFRLLRMKKAAGLLISNNYRITDAAYETGYEDAKYFSRVFKEEFGMTPSQFKNAIEADKLEAFLLNH